MKAIIKLANKLSSILTDESIVGSSTSKLNNVKSELKDNTLSSKSILKRDDIVSFSILTDVEIIRKNFIGKIILDTYTVDEILSLLNEKIFTDDISFQDTIDFINELQFENNFETTDIIENLDFLKILFEEINITDEESKSFTKVEEDTYGLDSFGFLISQDYTEDNTYFLEDYVGQSRVFN